KYRPVFQGEKQQVSEHISQPSKTINTSLSDLINYDIAEAYFYGRGMQQDYIKAKEYYELSANNDFPLAQNMLGRIYLEGLGVDKDTQRGIQWLSKAAKQGIPSAQYKLGEFYGKKKIEKNTKNEYFSLRK